MAIESTDEDSRAPLAARQLFLDLLEEGDRPYLLASEFRHFHAHLEVIERFIVQLPAEVSEELCQTKANPRNALLLRGVLALQSLVVNVQAAELVEARAQQRLVIMRPASDPCFGHLLFVQAIGLAPLPEHELDHAGFEKREWKRLR